MAERFGQDLVLLEKLAAGGMAEVYRAKQHGYAGFEKTVALKRILQNYAQNEEFKNMFRLEANLTGGLQHPNVVQVFGNGEHEGYLYLVMEFVDGRNVRQILARADKRKIRIPIEYSLFVISEAAKGLDYAHDFHDEKTGQHLEVVHRDMSPQNIMVGYDGHVKIVDFGIAKAAARSGQTRAGVLKGKFGYMSPEQAQGMTIDRRTDIFALGIILFELLTQRRLFTAEDDLKTLQLVKEARVPRPSKYNPDIPPALDSIILKALARERSDRFDKASEFYAEITRFLVQNYPKFLPMDFSKWVKEIFAEDIKEEKKKREKINAELPPRLATPVASTPRAEAAIEAQDILNGAEESPTSVSKTPVTKTEATLSQEAPTEASQVKFVKEINVNGAKSLELPPGSPAKISFPQAGLNSGNSSSPFPLKISTPKEEPETKIDTQTDYAEPTSPHLTQVSTPRSERIKTKNYKPKSKSLGWPARLSLILLVAAVGWEFGLKNHISGFLPERAPASVEVSTEKLGFGEPVDSPVAEVEVSPDREPTQVEPEPIAAAPTVAPTPDPVPVSTPPPTAAAPLPVSEPKLTVKTNPPPKVADLPLRPSQRFVKKEGYLTLVSTPDANEIFLNGKRLEDQNGNPIRTPLRNYPLEPGDYNVELKNSFFGVNFKGKAKLEPDRFKTLDVILKKP